MVLRHEFQGLLGAQGLLGDKAPAVEEMFQGPAHIRLIIHDQDLFTTFSHTEPLKRWEV